MISAQPRSLSRALFLALVVVLPLHTVFFRVQVAWKPWLILLPILAAIDIWEARGYPWSRRASVGIGVFLAAVLVSWPGPSSGATFWRLFLALAAGGLLLLVTGRHAVQIDEVVNAVFWSGAAIATTAVVLAMVTNGVFGASAVQGVNDIWLVDRVNKAAYLGSGFIALTNWHQDPGYSALWTNVWIAISIVGVGRGMVRAPRWVPALVLGGLAMASVLTYARTGWIGLGMAVVAALASLWRTDRAMLRRGLKAVGWGALVAALLLSLQVALDPPGVGGDVADALDFRFTYLFALGQIDVGEPGYVDPELVVEDNRLAVWREYESRFAESPIRGIGLGTGWGIIGLQEPHNLGVELLAETGVIGVLGFIALLVSLGGGVGTIAGPALAVIATAGLTETVLFEPVLWFALGLWLAASRAREPTTVAAGAA